VRLAGGLSRVDGAGTLAAPLRVQSDGNCCRRLPELIAWDARSGLDGPRRGHRRGRGARGRHRLLPIGRGIDRRPCMNVADIAITISGLGKRYTIGAREAQYDTLRDRIAAA